MDADTMDRDLIMLAASIGFAALAAEFCTEAEAFPVFMAWVKESGKPADWTPEKLEPLVSYLYGLVTAAERVLPDGVQ